MTDLDKEHDGDRSIETLSKQVFERSTAALDGQTRSRLTRARVRALEELASPSVLPGWLLGRATATAAAVIVASFAGLAVWQAVDDETTTVQSFAESGDFELLLSDEELDMLEELEFYAWLVEQPEVEIQDVQLDSDG